MLDRRTLDVKLVRQPVSMRSGDDLDVHSFRDLDIMIVIFSVRPSPNYAHLPCLNQYTSTRSEKNHPTRIFVVVNEVEQDDQLDKHIRNDLKSHINSLVG